MPLDNSNILITDPDKLLEWSTDKAGRETPEAADVFKSGDTYMNFLHLYFTIGILVRGT